MTDNRAIIDGKLYVRMVSDGPMMALTAQELTTRVLNFEKRLEEKDRYIAALEARINDLKQDARRWQYLRQFAGKDWENLPDMAAPDSPEHADTIVDAMLMLQEQSK